MRRQTRSLIIVGLAILFVPACSNAADDTETQENKAVDDSIRTDLYGDPLPQGAIARLGTLRLRHNGPRGAVVFSPNGKWLATWRQDSWVRVSELATGRMLLKSRDRVLALRFSGEGITLVNRHQVVHWGLVNEKKTLLFKYDTPAGVSAMTFSPNGKTVVSSNRYVGKIRFRDAATGKVTSQLAEAIPGTRLAISPDGKYLAATRSDDAANSSLYLWNLVTNTKVRLHDQKHRAGYTFSFSADNKFLAVVQTDKEATSLSLWNLVANTKVQLYKTRSPTLCTLAFSPDGKILAAGAYSEGIVYFWDVVTGKKLRQTPHERGLRAIVFSPNGQTIAYGGDRGIIHFDNMKTGREFKQIDGKCSIQSLSFTHDGKTIAASMSLFQRQRTRLWNIASGKELLAYPRHEQRIGQVAFFPDGKRIVTSSEDQTIRIWDASVGKQLLKIDSNMPLEVKRSPPFSLSSDGKVLATVDKRTIYFWDTNVAKEIRRFKSVESRILAIAISPDNKLFATLGNDRRDSPEIYFHEINLRNIATGEVRLRIPEVSSSAQLLAFSPDGKWLGVSTHDLGKSIGLFNITTGKRVHSLEADGETHGYVSPRFAFSPDGKLLASGRARKIRIWDIARGKLLRTIESQTSVYQALAFSPNGKVLAICGGAQRCLFAVASGQLLWNMPSTESSTRSVAFSPDGKRLVTAGDDGSALVWGLTPAQVNPEARVKPGVGKGTPPNVKQ